MEGCVWRSHNGNWEFKRLYDDSGLTIVDIIRYTGRKPKRFEVMVEHIRKGTKMIWGGESEENYDNIVAPVVLPKFVEAKIMELADQLRETDK
jgi:hypothetical protein